MDSEDRLMLLGLFAVAAFAFVIVVLVLTGHAERTSMSGPCMDPTISNEGTY